VFLRFHGRRRRDPAVAETPDRRDQPLLADEPTRWPPGVDHLAIDHPTPHLDDETEEDDEVASRRECVGYRTVGHRSLSVVGDRSVLPGRDEGRLTSGRRRHPGRCQVAMRFD
jgi:hypothetical protein